MPDAIPPGEAPATAPLVTHGEPLTADFFRKLIGENTATIAAKLDRVTGDVAALNKTVPPSLPGSTSIRRR